MTRPLAKTMLLAALLTGAWACARRSQEPEPAAGALESAHLSDVAPPVGDAWRKLLAAERLGAHVAALESRVRPAIRLATTPNASLRLGQSRIGGQPDLPADLVWPQDAGVPLAFVAQINLAELPAGSVPPLLPPDGHLWFFYVADQSAWGFDPKDAGKARVFHRPAGAALSRVAPPKSLPEGGELTATALAFEGYDDLPELDSDPPLIRLSDAEQERYMRIRDYLASADVSASHKLLGHAQPVQGSMEHEVSLVTGGLYCGDATCYADPRAEKLVQDADRWRLLLQLDSDDNASMMWGDAGMLYFWIREEDLTARRFDRTWTILQCY